MVTLTDTSVLRLIGVDLPPYSARGLVQELKTIPQATALRRTVNGGLLDVSAPQFRKYETSISNSSRPDVQPPSWDGIFPGLEITVYCIAELCQMHSGFSTETSGFLSTDTETPPLHLGLHRPHVHGSIRFEDGFVFYRPILQMRITALSQKVDEYGATVDWSLMAEEI